MIGSLRGKIISKTEKHILLETGGVGYKISVTPEVLATTKEDSGEVFLWIYTHVREDVFDLYGFKDKEEQEFFEMLLGVSGIGPKGALAILGVATLQTLRKAISTGEVSYMTKVSGIGKKTAEKIILELKDKILDDKSEDTLRDELDALEALKSLGYSQYEAREALKKVPADADTSTKIHSALKILGGK